jgi:hypothetical protein
MQSACAVMSSVASPVLSNFSTLCHKGHDFREKLLNLKFVFLFSLQILRQIVLILKITQRDTIINIHWLYCKVYVIFVRF